MTGNVSEWVSDGYGVYPSASVSDPTGPSSGAQRALRGGGWVSPAFLARVANRAGSDPINVNGDVGFRLSRTSP